MWHPESPGRRNGLDNACPHTTRMALKRLRDLVGGEAIARTIGVAECGASRRLSGDTPLSVAELVRVIGEFDDGLHGPKVRAMARGVFEALATDVGAASVSWEPSEMVTDTIVERSDRQIALTVLMCASRLVPYLEEKDDTGNMGVSELEKLCEVLEEVRARAEMALRVLGDQLRQHELHLVRQVTAETRAGRPK